MKIHYLSVEYDKYWHQLVVGHSVWQLGVGLVYWKRLFGIGRAHHEETC